MGILLPLRMSVRMQRLSVRCLRGVLGGVSRRRWGCAVDRWEEEGGRERREEVGVEETESEMGGGGGQKRVKGYRGGSRMSKRVRLWYLSVFLVSHFELEVNLCFNVGSVSESTIYK